MGTTEDTLNELKKASVLAIYDRLSSGPQGLSAGEASRRQEHYGPNKIPEKRQNTLVVLLRYFWGPIPWMIELAAVLSAYISHWEDFGIISTLLLTNAAVGFWQERKAQNAIEALRKRLAQKARVLRDGKWQVITSEALVPGDVVRVRLGDIIPADVKVTGGDYLLVDESALTGESLPVEKHVSDIAYSSSVAKQGEVDCMVVSTGLSTFFGRTTSLVEQASNVSHLKRSVTRIGYYLVGLALTLGAVVAVLSITGGSSLAETIQFVLVLMVAAIPAALPAVLSVTLAVGAMDLSKKQAIVSKLESIEEMAGMDVLCSDKTGTITKNELTVREVTPLGNFSSDDVLRCGMMASRGEDMDPMDLAIIKASRPSDPGGYSVLNFRPFDPVSKRTEATVRDGQGRTFKVSKGAPQAIMELIGSRLDSDVEEVVEVFGRKGYRALGVAETGPTGWRYVGVIGLYDPPREDSAETIRTAKGMGIDVKLVTGDHIAIAKQIAEQVDLDSNISLASTFMRKPPDEAEMIVERSTGFAEVFPEHKYRIVELLQGKDHIVGMTGDGVNDAPALKKANVGIAVDGSTDAARSAADIVLTQPGLSVIIDALKESRKIFQRINNYVIYRLAETIRVLFFIAGSIIVFGFYPVTALMIVLLAILNDLPIMTMAYDNVVYSNKPEKWNLKGTLSVATLLGVLGVASSFLILYIGLSYFGLSHDVLQSFILPQALGGGAPDGLRRPNQGWILVDKAI